MRPSDRQNLRSKWQENSWVDDPTERNDGGSLAQRLCRYAQRG
jgi:hypothetical protein